jgi:YD repeat-containing protein
LKGVPDDPSQRNENDGGGRRALDASDRRTSEAWFAAGGTATTRSFTYVYDADGRQTNVTERDGSGTTLSVEADTYDALGRLTSTDNNGTPNQPRVVVSNTYDVDGNRTTAVTSVNGSTSYTNSYTYDTLDRLSVETQTGSGIANKKVSYVYDNAGDVTAVNRYNTSNVFLGQTTYQYDPTTGRLTLLADTPWGSGTSSYTDTYDLDDRRTLVQFNADYATYNNTYTYDHDGQLTGETSDNGGIGNYDYGYDLNGNRTSESDTITADNRVTADTHGTYTYDHEGNRATKVSGSATWTYAYDARQRLTGITTNTGTNTTQTVTYTYDASDRRIRKLVTGTNAIDERYAYDDGNGDTDLAQVFTGTSAASLTQRYFSATGTSRCRWRRRRRRTPASRCAGWSATTRGRGWRSPTTASTSSRRSSTTRTGT